MEFAIALLVLVLVGVYVAWPLTGHGRGEEATPSEDPERAELEALKLAKYREIRDAEDDLAQRKLSEADWRRQDGQLRAEAVAILRRIDALDARAGAERRPARGPDGDPADPPAGDEPAGGRER